MFNWFPRSPEEPQASGYCNKGFIQDWGAFVDRFVDSIAANGPSVQAPTPSEQTEPHPTIVPAAERVVAIGDLHGDISKTQRAFRLGGLTDEQDRWIGGPTIAVQVGDQLDRGDNEVEILYFLERLQKEAAKAGGALYILNGNHETMNVAGRFRYATAPAIWEFDRWQKLACLGDALKSKCNCSVQPQHHPTIATPSDGPKIGMLDAGTKARWAALSPGGPITQRFLAKHPIVLQVGSTVFVHGGVLPEHAAYGLEKINRETQDWMMGHKGQHVPRFLSGRQAIVWSRDYSTEDTSRVDCEALQRALSMIPGAKRMVVGHTIQDSGINSACGNRVFRIDVGMSKGCGGGNPEVLEILQDSEVRRLEERKGPQPLSDQGGSPAPTRQTVKAWLRDMLSMQQPS
ncbi:hypothetical protein WJX72_002638 [[Myrmecia] bisecta]|uniref:Calcineurin-like phosphoesterase domain-containing protein n=1 Tax=[Myrmecia] bisecta TaxID=41462 RepID=A0AAW1QEG5_9CHLO